MPPGPPPRYTAAALVGDGAAAPFRAAFDDEEAPPVSPVKVGATTRPMKRGEPDSMSSMMSTNGRSTMKSLCVGVSVGTRT